MSESARNWPEWTKELSGGLRNLRNGAPEVMKAFDPGIDRPRHRRRDAL